MKNNTYTAFKRFANLAYHSPAANPCLCYSVSKGWFVESGIHPRADDCLVRLSANYDLPSGERSISDYRSSWQRISENFEITQP
jgi:hypothetical protein